MKKSKLFSLFVFALMTLAFYAGAAIATEEDYSIVLEDVELRPGVTSDINLDVFVNEDKPHGGITMFVVHGYVHTAKSWKPFVESLFDSDEKVSKIVAIDLPGRGGSSLPDGAIYGDLLLEDYVNAIMTSLERIEDEEHIKPDIILGHSQGGLLIQMVQQKLIDAGSSFKKEFKIKDAVFLASAGPKQIPWNLVDSGQAGGLLEAFLVLGDPVLGNYVAIPDWFWPNFFFSDLTGTVSSKAPTPQEITENGYNAPAPLLATLGLVGSVPFERPSVDEGIFSKDKGTSLTVISYEQDTSIRPEENALLYQYLTGDDSDSSRFVLEGPETVHDLHVSDPGLLISSLPDHILGK